MSAFLRPVVSLVLVLATSPGVLEARPPATLGDPPPAPTPEEVARLPRRNISKHGPVGPCLEMFRRGSRATSSGVGAGGGSPSVAGGLASRTPGEVARTNTRLTTGRKNALMAQTIQGLLVQAI